MGSAPRGIPRFGMRAGLRAAAWCVTWSLIPAPVLAGTFTVFSKTYVRSTGAPVTEIDTFAVRDPSATFVLKGYNGGLTDASGEAVASSVIAVNGVVVFGPDEFNQQVVFLEKPVTLTASTTFSVELRGKPGGTITWVIEGVDNTPPVIAAAVTPPSNAAGWHRTDPTVTFSCADATSGVAAVTAPITVTAEGADQAVTGTCTDRAGNTAQAQVPIHLDVTPPTVTATVTPAPNAVGWHRTDPTVRFGATDALSGVETVSPPVTVTTEGADQAVVGRATDQAGNVGLVTVAIALDKTAPALAITAPGEGQFFAASPIPVSGTARDVLSLSAVTLNGQPVTVTGGQWSTSIAVVGGSNTITATAEDAAGNTATASATVTLDNEPPVITLAEPVDGSAGNQPTIAVRGTVTDNGRLVLAELTCVDAGGVRQVESLPGGPVTTACTVGPDGPVTLTVSAVDAAGNRGERTATVTLDRVPPVITASISPAANAAGWHAAPATVTFTCTDALAGLATCPDPVTITTEGANQVVSGTASDRAGNAASASLTVNLDLIPPTITAAISLAANAAGWHRTDPTVTFTCGDALSGVATCPAPITVTTEGAGQRVSGAAVDVAGQTAEAAMTVNLDKTPPSLVIATPADGQFVAVSPIMVSGMVSDALSSPTIAVNGQPVAVSPSGQWSVAVALVGGPNPITVVAGDAAGHQTTSTRTVTLDHTPPVITLTEPVDGAATNRSPIAVRGTITDDGQLASVELVCDIGGGRQVEPLPGQPGAFTALCPVTTDGPVILTVTAVDAAGNRASAERRVTYDATPPGLAVTSPSEALLTNNPTVIVAGTLDDPTATLTVDGQAAPAGASWRVERVLADGPHTVDIVATDPAGNTTTVTRTVTVDTAPPTITLTAPADRAVTNQPTVTVTGAVSEPVATLTVNGQAITPAADLTFTATVALTEGDTLLTVTATDPAGNSGTAIRTVTLDTQPPALTVTEPAPGLLTRTRVVRVAGTVDDPQATLTVNGTAAPVSTGAWGVDVTLAEGAQTISIRAVDAVGNSATRELTVTVDSVPPVVQAGAPSDVAAGENVTFTGTADDAGGLVRLTLAIGALTVADATLADTHAARQAAYTVPVTAAVGDTLTVTVAAIDRAGNVGTATATLHVTAAATLPGFVQGEVFDDTLGLPLAGASVSVGGGAITPVGDTGVFLLTQPAGDVVVRVTKPGSTAVERAGTIQAGRKLTLLDARLTPLDGTEAIVDTAGGVAPSASSPVRLDVPAGALATTAGVRVTPLSRQGLIVPLPPGWTPIAAVQIDATVTTWASPSTLIVSRAVPSTATVTVVRYDEAAHRWLVVGPARGYASTLEADVVGPGQYALILADTGAHAPPAPVAGQPLAGVAVVAYPDGLAATGTVVPRAAPPTKDGPIQPAAQGTVTLTSPTPLPSGMMLMVGVSERFDPRQGEAVIGAGYRQDLIMYRAGEDGTPGDLAAAFPITPSRRYSLSELLLGTITLDIRTPEGEIPTTVVGAGGATIATPEGAYVTIAAQALAADVPVVFTVLPGPSVPPPAGWRLVGTVALDLAQATLASSAALTFPTPVVCQGVEAGPCLVPSKQILVAQVVPVAGGRRLRLAAVARLEGGLLHTETQISGLTLPGLRQGGEYVFLQPPTEVGFITGVVRGSDDVPRGSALVEVTGQPLVDQTGPDGRFVVVAPVGSTTLTAHDLLTAEAAEGTVTIAQRDAVVARDLTLAVVPFAVTTIEPAGGATGVSIRAVLRVTFNRAVDVASLTAATITFRDATSDVGVLAIPSADGTQLTLYPRALVGNTAYTLTLTTGLKDRLNRPLAAPVTTSFTTANVVPPPRPAAGRLGASFPDDVGMITVTATQGTVDPVHTVVLLNLATGETVSLTVLANGSFSGRIFGSIGDDLQLLIRDADGNQTEAALPPMRAADGRTFVSITGGEVRGPDDSRLVIPAQALKVPAVFTLTPVPLADPNAPLPAPLPDGLVPVGAWRLTSQGIPWRVEATFAVPKPASFPAGVHPFVLKALTLPDGTARWAMMTTAKVLGSEIITASPPFPGITSEGVYAVVAYPDSVTTVVVSGVVFRDNNSNGVYDGGDLAAAGAYVGEGSFASFVTAPSPLAVAQTDGTYALYLSVPSGTTSFAPVLTALDPRGSLSRTETLPTIDSSTTSALTANLLLEDLTVSRQQDTASPTLVLTAKGPDLFAGTSLVNSPLTVTLAAQDDQVVASLALTQDGVVQTLAPQGLGTAKSTAEFVLIPTDPGVVTFVGTVEDLTGKRAQQRLTLRIVTTSELSQLPPPIPNTPPAVVTAGISPPDGSADLTIDTVVRVPFSEPVQATATSLYLRNRTTGETVETELGGTPAEVVLTPKGLLHYGATYDVVLTDQITDSESQALANPLSVSFATMPLRVLSRTPLVNGRGVQLDGTTLIGLEQAQGLVTLDVGEPGAPTALGRLDLLGQTNNGFAVGQEGVVVAHKYGTQTFGTGPLSLDGVDVSSSVSASVLFGLLRLVDVSTPTNPTFIKGAALTWPPNGDIEQLFGQSPGEGIPMRVAVVGDTAYVVTVPLGLQVVDLATLKTRTDRRTPIVQRTINLGGVPRDVVAVGDLVLAVSRLGLTLLDGATFGERLSTLDLPNAFRVSAASGYRVVDPLTGAEQDKTLALVTAGSIVHVVDVTAPALPALLGSLDLGEPLFSLIGIPGRRIAFAGNGFNTVHALDLTDPTHPKPIGTLKGEVAPRYLAADDQTLYVDDAVNAVQFWAEGTIKFLDPTNDEQEYDGGVTDGVTRIKVRVTGRMLEGQDTVWLRLNDPVTKNLALGVGNLCLAATPSNEPCLHPDFQVPTPMLNVPVIRQAGQPAYAEALYQVPDTFVRTLEQTQEAQDKRAAVRFADVTVYKANNTQELVSRVLKLKRPPVLLIHGIWSAGKDEYDAWKVFEPLLNIKRQFLTAKADYEATNAAEFATNAESVPDFLDKVLGKARAERLAATKVDVVAHSMGGLITREYCLQNPDDCKRQIHKFITIDTPHTGTEIANEVIKVGLDPAEQMCKNKVITKGLHALKRPNRVDGGAVFDLAKDSVAIQRLALTQVLIPSHTIAGDTPLGAGTSYPIPLTEGFFLSAPLFFAYDRDTAKLWTGLYIFCNRVPNGEFLIGDTGTKVVFPDGGDDRLVPVASQLGGLTGNGRGLAINNVDHVTAHDSQLAVTEVTRLLEAPVTVDFFQMSGFWGGLR